MQNPSEYFRGKHVTLLGLGLLGRGVGDAAFLAECGAEVIVTDKKSAEELAASVEKLKGFPNITFHLGGHRLEDFTNADLVIKAAGVPLRSPEIAAAQKAGVQVAMSTALFAKFALEAGTQVVGVTGTRGKSTVAHMINHSLKITGRQTIVGGNVRGISTLAMLPQLYEGYPCTVVLELDSWQLQGFGDLHISPHIAVFTNLMPDHQDYYPSMEAYFEDKANIFRFQMEGDSLFAGQQVFERVRAARPQAPPQLPSAIPPEWKLAVIGAHNRENAALAAAALQAMGLLADEIRKGLETFQPVEGRLQLVEEVHGVQIYNDNNATTPEATIAALSALGEGITLIAGGSEKGLDLTSLIEEIKKRVTTLIVLTHPNYKGSVRLAAELQVAGIEFSEAASLTEAVNLALKDAKVLLFSPAFASFGMFKNEYERGDQFIEIARSYDPSRTAQNIDEHV